MKYFDKLQYTLDYIENNIDKDITLENIAKNVAISKYYFHRIFKNIFGISATEYIRKRRLSIAAKSLLGSNLRVIDVAFDAKYSSQEAFTRSFKKMFGFSPKNIETYKEEINYFEKADLMEIMRHMNHDQAQFKDLEYELIHVDEMKFVGIEKTRKNFQKENELEVSQQWNIFSANLNKVKNQAHQNVEVCAIVSFELDTEYFNYFSGVRVNKYEDVPKNMKTREIPARTYLKFLHKGEIIPNITKTIDYILWEWLPKSKYDLLISEEKFVYFIENYTEKSTHFEDSIVEIFVPIQSKLSYQ